MASTALPRDGMSTMSSLASTPGTCCASIRLTTPGVSLVMVTWSLASGFRLRVVLSALIMLKNCATLVGITGGAGGVPVVGAVVAPFGWGLSGSFPNGVNSSASLLKYHIHCPFSILQLKGVSIFTL